MGVLYVALHGHRIILVLSDRQWCSDWYPAARRRGREAGRGLAGAARSGIGRSALDLCQVGGQVVDNYPSPVTKLWGWAVWASRMIPNSSS